MFHNKIKGKQSPREKYNETIMFESKLRKTQQKLSYMSAFVIIYIWKCLGVKEYLTYTIAMNPDQPLIIHAEARFLIAIDSHEIDFKSDDYQI